MITGRFHSLLCHKPSGLLAFGDLSPLIFFFLSLYFGTPNSEPTFNKCSPLSFPMMWYSACLFFSALQVQEALASNVFQFPIYKQTTNFPAKEE
ncbi:hypothetical protein K435DRAFT_315455 [Dendrothele bispora CBS 962.96]|uniref:Uncharacterized protein n=1 Tax=Dendrothele bispora (strain CBS 962.96) TaxID=1314807 RepID=A0A4S8LH19_DENBC|nr:hypothetical protein K435DRAFT_315455 [Dendrothele bispora CBS 962.96]